MDICVGNLNTIDSDNDLQPSQRQAIIWTNTEYCWLAPYEQTSVKF